MNKPERTERSGPAAKNMRILAAFAHPDDIELLCAGTLRLLVERGCELRCVTMTGGDLGSNSGTRDAIRDIRINEATRAAGILGGSYSWAGLNDFQVVYSLENLRLVTEQIRQFSPDVVFTHSPDCYMLDHEETARLVRAACFAAPVPLFETNTAATTNGVPALYYSDALEGVDKFGREVEAEFWVDIAGTFKTREQSLACHVSQREWLRSHHGVDEYLITNEQLAATHGAKCGLKYAEGFRQHLGHAYPRENRLADVIPLLERKSTETTLEKNRHTDHG